MNLRRKGIPAMNLISEIPTSRVALSRAITLIESSLQSDREKAAELMSRISEIQSSKRQSVKIGWSGSPGVGKSTFIETIGLKLCKNHKLAVLAIDPSSSVTGGSILGDKTRMLHLSNHRNSFIRPSPNKQNLGGVAKMTQQVIKLCEYANYDTIFVETVGVGQSEMTVAEMVDMFVLLCPPAGGDELQGIKKGIVELADLVVVNKSDGHLERAAKDTQAEYTSAIKMLRHGAWKPPVLRASAKTGFGIEEVVDTMYKYIDVMTKSGQLETKRRLQRKQWMWRIAQNMIIDDLHASKSEVVAEIESRVMNNKIMAAQGAEQIIKLLK
eukprot:NODE_411_length_9170_cov_0.431154.p3 type:complete len:327 gc:universal NODE_411_length_9170_cov_0.431154:6840-7820(+)